MSFFDQQQLQLQQQQQPAQADAVAVESAVAASSNTSVVPSVVPAAVATYEAQVSLLRSQLRVQQAACRGKPCTPSVDKVQRQLEELQERNPAADLEMRERAKLVWQKKNLEFVEVKQEEEVKQDWEQHLQVMEEGIAAVALAADPVS